MCESAKNNFIQSESEGVCGGLLRNTVGDFNMSPIKIRFQQDSFFPDLVKLD